MMRTIKIYVPPGQPGPLLEFLPTLDEKLRRKLLQQIVRLSQIHLCDLKEPHFKHFVLEKYNQLYELREKNKVLARIIFTIRDGDIISPSTAVCGPRCSRIITTSTPRASRSVSRPTA